MRLMSSFVFMLSVILFGCDADYAPSLDGNPVFPTPDDEVHYDPENPHVNSPYITDTSDEAFVGLDAVSYADREIFIDGYVMADICTAGNTNALGSDTQRYHGGNYDMVDLDLNDDFGGVSIIQPLRGAIMVIRMDAPADTGDEYGNGAHGVFNGDVFLADTACLNEAHPGNDGMIAYWIDGCARIYGDSAGGHPYRYIGQCDWVRQ